MAGDPRIPVRFGSREEAGDGCALLIEGAPDGPGTGPIAYFVPGPAAGHPVGCACCVPRRPAAEALTRLFLTHARGGSPLEGVVAVTRTSAGRRAVLDALNGDMVTKARFRLG